jgi:hypothetical protein
MSSAIGKKQISDLIAAKFVSSPLNASIVKDFREELDTRLVIMDISQRALEPNQLISKASFGSSYAKFIEVVQGFLKGPRRFSSIEELEMALANKVYDINKRGVVLIDDPIRYTLLLVAKDFDSIRRFISAQISNKMGKDTYFGNSYRRFNYLEIADSIDSFNSSGFAVEHRAKYGLPESANILNKNGDLTDGKSDTPLITKRSNMDIGHMFDKGNALYDTPLASRLESVYKGNFSTGAIAAAKASLDELHEIHSKLSFTYHNKGISSIGNIDAKATLSLTLQHYKLNNLLAVKEAKIYRDFLNKLAIDTLGKEFVNISGSNTLKQDIALLLKNTLKGTTKKVAGHAEIIGNIVFKNKQKGSSSVQKFNVTKAPPKVRTFSGQFYSLALLQTLINENLQNVISANMGSGSEKRILNYRTGRFAASAAVERMSQSRQGMITAFYTYMKYPYQTFEPGYAQGSPKTRNPKLLIAKSIREIAATKVGNRLRAVSV